MTTYNYALSFILYATIGYTFGAEYMETKGKFTIMKGQCVVLYFIAIGMIRSSPNWVDVL